MFRCICIIFSESYLSNLLKLQKSFKLQKSSNLQNQKKISGLRQSRRIKIPEDDVAASKHVAVFTVYTFIFPSTSEHCNIHTPTRTH